MITKIVSNPGYGAPKTKLKPKTKAKVKAKGKVAKAQAKARAKTKKILSDSARRRPIRFALPSACSRAAATDGCLP